MRWRVPKKARWGLGFAIDGVLFLLLALTTGVHGVNALSLLVYLVLLGPKRATLGLWMVGSDEDAKTDVDSDPDKGDPVQPARRARFFLAVGIALMVAATLVGTYKFYLEPGLQAVQAAAKIKSLLVPTVTTDTEDGRPIDWLAELRKRGIPHLPPGFVVARGLEFGIGPAKMQLVFVVPKKSLSHFRSVSLQDLDSPETKGTLVVFMAVPPGKANQTSPNGALRKVLKTKTRGSVTVEYLTKTVKGRRAETATCLLDPQLMFVAMASDEPLDQKMVEGYLAGL